MKAGLEIIVPTRDLLHILNFAGSVVEKRNVVSELSHIKLTAKGNMLTIGATDIDLYLNQTIGAEVIKEGETTVSSQTLSDIVRKVKDGEVKITQSQGSDKLKLVGKNCRFELLTLPADKFPMMEDVESETHATVPCKEFARILDYTSFSMSNEETRYNLNGVYLHVKDGQLKGAATDGHRLSFAAYDGDGMDGEIGVIVPRKTVHEILKIVKDNKNIEGKIKITFGENKIRFELDSVVLVSKLIDGQFPEYSSFIPSDNESKLTVKTEILAEAIDRVAAITVDKFRAIKISIDKDKLNITASGEAKGAASEDLVYSENENDLCKYDGDAITIGFNPKYISDVLSAMRDEVVVLSLNDSQSPLLIRSHENQNDSFVVMPVKV